MRPGPVRRLILGRYRWYPVAWGCCGYSACCDSCTWEPCCSAGSAVTTSPSPEVPQETKPTLAPTRASPAAPTPGPTPKSSTDDDLNRLLQPPDRSPAAPKKPTGPTTDDKTGRRDSGMLAVNVPSAAKVMINGRETRTGGDYREFVSHGLKDGKVYPYTIRALVLARDGSAADTPEGGRWVWITKTVYLRAGDRIAVTFSDNLDLERTQLAQVEPAGIR